jgi:ribosomal protein S12 methylthiotransferase
MKHIGKTIEVLVEEIETDSYIGRTEYDSPEIDNSVIFTSDEQLKPGDFVFVKISDAFDYDLVGYHVKRG